MLTPLSTAKPALFRAALLKMASRCNLDCDYCYMYKHADQSWRSQPKLMSRATVDAFAQRLRDYVVLEGLKNFAVIFHGGEPLLYGATGLANAAATIQSTVGDKCKLEFSLQTNGVLLNTDSLDVLEAAGISVSLSLDGPRATHDRHRLTHAGESTYAETLRALELLRGRGGSIFRGVIAVIDPAFSPRDAFEFFAQFDLPRLDFLLPDATHSTPPVGRDLDPTLYERWICDALDLWFREFPSMPVRWFDAVLASRVGVPSPTDVMGFGAVSLLVIDTDGSYADHDVFKIVSPGAGRLNASVETESISAMSTHPSVLEHGHRLTLDGIASECRTCAVVDACAGGCVMHRAHATRGLAAPTVYCREMFALLKTGTRLLRDALVESSSPADSGFRLPLSGGELVARCTQWRIETERRADHLAASLGVDRPDAAAAVLLPHAYSGSLEPRKNRSEPHSRWLGGIRLHSDDPRLVTAFSDSVRALLFESAQVQHALASMDLIEECLLRLDSRLPEAISALISDIIFVESTVADEGGIFSFSDDKAPNVLYIAPFAGGKPIPAEDLADSIFHEFLHQVLYHYESSGPILFEREYPKFPAPWRAGLRPAGGFFHGTFVFSGLHRLWAALAASPPSGVSAHKASRNAAKTKEQAIYGMSTLREFALLTPRGDQLVDDLAASLNVVLNSLEAPGIGA
jgi:uncharacterized protein